MPQTGRYPRNGGGGVIVERFKNDIFFSLFISFFLQKEDESVNAFIDFLRQFLQALARSFRRDAGGTFRPGIPGTFSKLA